MLITNLFDLTMPSHLRHRIKIITILFIAYLLLNVSACGAKEETKQTSNEQTTNAATEVSASSKAEAELQLHKDLWLEKGISDYQIEMQKLCFCSPDAVRLMVFEIRDNKIESVRYADSNEAVEPELYSENDTVEGLFLLAEKTIANDPAELNIVYDEDYGYIKEYTVNIKENIADDEITIIASNMKQNK